MKRIILIVIFALLLIAPYVASTATAEPNGWSVSVSPLFAFSGDTVNVTVTSNVPGQSAFLQLANGSTSYIDESFFLDGMGSCFINMTIPFDLPSGIYNITVIANTGDGAMRVANTTIDITLDQVIYQGILHQQDLDAIAAANTRIDHQNAMLVEQGKSIDSLTTLAYSLGIIVISVTVLFIWLYQSYIRDHIHARTKGGALKKAAKGIDFILNPDPKGTVGDNIPGVRENLERMLKADAGTTVEPTLIVACAESDTGMIAKRVNLVPQVQEQVIMQPNPPMMPEPKKVIIEKHVIYHPAEKKEEDVDTIFDRAHALETKLKAAKVPEPPKRLTSEQKPIIIPAGLSAKEHTMHVLTAQKMGRKWVEGPPLRTEPVTVPVKEPVIAPWNAAPDYAAELKQQAVKEGREFKVQEKPAEAELPPKRKRSHHKLGKAEGVGK